jgi:hypothetical protein
MELSLSSLDLVLDAIMSAQLVDNQLVVELARQVGVFKEFEAEGSRGGFESKVNKSELGLRVSNRVAINT